MLTSQFITKINGLINLSYKLDYKSRDKAIKDTMIECYKVIHHLRISTLNIDLDSDDHFKRYSRFIKQSRTLDAALMLTPWIESPAGLCPLMLSTGRYLIRKYELNNEAVFGYVCFFRNPFSDKIVNQNTRIVYTSSLERAIVIEALRVVAYLLTESNEE